MAGVYILALYAAEFSHQVEGVRCQYHYEGTDFVDCIL